MFPKTRTPTLKEDFSLGRQEVGPFIDVLVEMSEIGNDLCPLLKW